MTGPPTPEDRLRTRAGTAILLIGTVLVLWAWGNWVYRFTPRGLGPGPVVSSTPAGHTGVASATRKPLTSSLAPEDEDPQSTDAAAAEVDQKRRAARMALVVIIGGVAALSIFICVIALARAARRYRAAALRRQLPPSAADDVWTMHKVPELEDDSSANEDQDGDEAREDDIDA